VAANSQKVEVTLEILSVVFFSFIVYLTIGIPLAVVPSYVQSLGFGPFAAGLAISVQYVATFLTRPYAGRTVDTRGAKQAVVVGLVVCGASGLFMMLTAGLFAFPWFSLGALFTGRLILGCGESLVATGAIMWGVGRVGTRYTAKVISWNGVATYGALAVGAPLGIFLETKFGFLSIGVSVVLLGWLSFPLARIKAGSALVVGERIPIRRVFRRVLPYGFGLALGSIGFGSLATFITLYYSSHRWPHAAFSLSVFGICFIGVRLLFASSIDRFGGYRVALVSFVVEVIGLLTLWQAGSLSVALVGAMLTGVGFSLIFPSLGVEAMSRVTVDNRGAALAMYSVFVDVALGITGPVGGIIATHFNFSAIFLFAALSAAGALTLTIVIYLGQLAPVKRDCSLRSNLAD
jgi:MFS family permease